LQFEFDHPEDSYDIHRKVEDMINPKKQVEKHFNNNPPTRELYKNKVARQNETEI